MSLDIEGVLSAHEAVGYTICRCGLQFGRIGNTKDEWDAAHRAHVAAVLRDQIEGALAEADAEVAGPLAEWLCDLLGEPRALVSGEVLAGLTVVRRAAHLSDTERAGGAG